MPADVVLTEARGRVLVITINRPEARNAVNRSVAEGVGAALDHLDADSALSVGVVTGAAGMFSAGMDLKGFARGERPVISDRGFGGSPSGRPASPCWRRSRVTPWPAGSRSASPATSSSPLATPNSASRKYASVSWPAPVACYVFPAGSAPGHAAILALTGTPISGDQGHRIGLVDRVTEPDLALAEALSLAEIMVANAPLALAASKAVLLGGFTKSEPEFWEWQRRRFKEVLSSKDAMEGARAFAERRPPAWQGK